MNTTQELLENEIKTLQKAAVLHANYSIEQYKKVLASLEELETEKKSLKEKVLKRTIHLEKEILERKKIEEKLQEDKILIEKYNKELHQDKETIQNYLDIVNNNVIISSTDEQGIILSASDAFCNITGYTINEILGKRHNIIQSKKTKLSTYEKLWKTISSGKEWKGEIQNKTKDGKLFWVFVTITIQFNDDGFISGYTAIMQDITHKKKIEELSITDGLTNIHNRRHFNFVFPRVINRAKRDNSLVSFIIIDIDFFKQYNDNYGHQMGDTVLIQVAQCIKNSLNRTDDYCFRVGGEEFGVIIKANSKEKAIEFTNQIKNNIEKLAIEHKHNSASPYVTASMGLYCAHAYELTNVDDIYKLTDDYLYKAKESGRNNVYVGC